MRFIALILICIGLQAQAEGSFFFDEKLGIKDFKKMTVFVNLNDGATGGCWTNLREVREYTEEKLKLAGFKIANSADGRMDSTTGQYWFQIGIHARKLGQSCFYSNRYVMEGWVWPRNIKHVAMLGEAFYNNGVKKDNVNQVILEQLNELFTLFPKK